jgi:hypothetical protein
MLVVRGGQSCAGAGVAEAAASSAAIKSFRMSTSPSSS